MQRVCAALSELRNDRYQSPQCQVTLESYQGGELAKTKQDRDREREKGRERNRDTEGQREGDRDIQRDRERASPKTSHRAVWQCINHIGFLGVQDKTVSEMLKPK